MVDDLVAEPGPVMVWVGSPSNSIWCEPCKDWVLRGQTCRHYAVQLGEPPVADQLP